MGAGGYVGLIVCLSVFLLHGGCPLVAGYQRQ